MVLGSEAAETAPSTTESSSAVSYQAGYPSNDTLVIHNGPPNPQYLQPAASIGGKHQVPIMSPQDEALEPEARPAYVHVCCSLLTDQKTFISY